MIKLKKCIALCAIMLLGGMGHSAYTQNIGVKTNLIADGLLSPNLGLEIGLAPKWTLELIGEFNGWTLSHQRQWKHWLAMPEARYWFCDRFSGHFLGIEAHGGQYNIGGFDGKYNLFGTNAHKLKDTRYQGWFVGGGITYGYAWILNRHWNLEAEIGIGYSYTRYDRFRCVGCGKKIENDKSHNYVGPTKAALNVVYLF